MARGDGARANPDSLKRALVVSTLAAFAFAQPLFDATSRHAAFFVAHGTGGLDLVAFALLLSPVCPLLLAGALAALARLHAGLGTAAHAVAISALAALIGLPLLARIPDVPAAPVFGAAFLLGVATAVGVARVAVVGTLLAAMAPALLVFPVGFLAFSPAARLLAPAGPEPGRSAERADADSRPPIFVFVFDELSTASLLDAAGNVDGGRFPNFARLAARSHWFRNATAVSHATEKAVPAILTGRRPAEGRLPALVDHPKNLFTLLEQTHRITAFETITRLCPARACEDTRSLGARARATGDLLADAAVVYLHLVTPAGPRAALPSIAGRWAGFRGDASALAAAPRAASRRGKPYHRLERARHFEAILAAIPNADSEKPPLFFAHSLLPHVPYQFLPDGSAYESIGELPGWQRERERWNENPALVAQAYHRYRLQLGYVDRLLGRALDTLEARGLLDPALLVVTADHGVHFAACGSRRGIHGDAAGSVLPVPLFVKLPGQRAAMRSDRNVESVDILPTVAAVAGVPAPDDVDGAALFTDAAPREEKRVLFHGREVAYEADLVPALLAEAGRLRGLLGPGSADDPFAHGAQPRLAGRRVAELTVATRLPQVAVRLDAWDEPAGLVRARVTGALLGTTDATALAVTVGGRIAATTRSYAEGGHWRFSAMLPPTAHGAPDAALAVYAVEDRTTLAPIARAPDDIAPPVAAGIRADPAATLLRARGIELVEEAALGGVGFVRAESAGLRIAGWVGDARQRRAPRRLLVVTGGEVVTELRAFGPRPDVAAVHGPALLETGFDLRLDPTHLGGAGRGDLRIFAELADGRGAELALPIEACGS